MKHPVFLFPQLQHDLIPQAQSSAADVELAQETQAFWRSMFQLFQQQVDDVAAAYPDVTHPDTLYLKVRPVLDDCAAVQAVHQRRGVLQDRLWANVLTRIAHDRSRLATVYQCQRSGHGGLELNPALAMPLHQLKTHIHRMPGGYLGDRDEDSFWTGVLYDHGVFLYGRGWLGPLNDELGQTVIHQVLAPHYPEFQPQTIVDLGCAVGHSTLPYAAAYPDARVWGIDLGASLLRYAIARARILNQSVYFSQQNAEHTDFADQSVDLVVSHILMHEIPGVARQRVFAESYRLLKPGGIMVHLESRLFLEPATLAARYFRDTEVWANSEPYLGSSKFTDFATYALEAGFAPEAFQIHAVPGYYAAQQGNAKAGWVALCGVKR